MPDQQVLALIRTNKSDKALDALYRHFPTIQKMIRRHGGSKQDAEDIFQEALILLVRKIREPDFQLTAQLSTYLYSVCRFMWKDELRRRKLPIPVDLEGVAIAAEETSVEELIKSEEQNRLAEKALQLLQDRCRELLLLFYEGRLKLKEIAEQMGYSSENTAKNQKYKCLEGAKRKLKELQYGN